MALSEERTIYYVRSVKVYQDFLIQAYPEGFYTRVINFPSGVNRTNEEHIKSTIRDQRKELSLGDLSRYWLKFRFNSNYNKSGNPKILWCECGARFVLHKDNKFKPTNCQKFKKVLKKDHYP